MALIRLSRAAALAGLLAAALAPAAPAGAAPSAAVSSAAAPGPTVDVSNASRCDITAPGGPCLLPFPNDYFTVPDASTGTGRRLNLDQASTPANVAGRRIDVADYNQVDGFSPGSLGVVRVPGLDTPAAFAATGAVTIRDPAESFRPDQPVVVINTKTLQRQLIWTELDSNQSSASAVDLLIRPEVNYEEGTRYVVALRRLRGANGALLAPSDAFRIYRDSLTSTQPEVNARRAHFEELFTTLGAAGIGREDLYLTWDFTVASERSLSSRVLTLRDDAFRQLGDTALADGVVQGSAPRFTVTRTTEFERCDPSGCVNDNTRRQDDRIARQIEGRFVVPCYLDKPGCPSGSKFHYTGTDTDHPTQLPGNVAAANFLCMIPRRGLEGARPDRLRPVLYGHGLLGSAAETTTGKNKALDADYGLMHCGTDWVGMAQEDIPNALASLNDLSQIPTVFDRVQQSMLNFLYLGRLLRHPQGFAADPAFRTAAGVPVIDTSALYYDGGSQGGIIGGALTAIAPDFTRSALTVPGMNYSTLLQRSTDFSTYAQFLYRAYPDETQRQLIFSLVQTLWDRSEANGYAHHMTTDTYPNTPPHVVLMETAYGDHQVATITAQVMARTIGAALRQPALDPGRSFETNPYVGFDRATYTDPPTPATRSLFTVWDVGPLRMEGGRVKGTPSPPVENKPNTEGVDPHGPDPGETVAGRKLKSDFWQPAGFFTDVCGTAPCYLDGYTGPAAPAAVVPEAPLAVLLPLIALLGLGLPLTVRRRRRSG